MSEHGTARLRDMVTAARRVVAFTGAGISTESGIPDFRSPGGLWTTNKPIEFDDFLASADMRKEAWRRKFAIDEATAGVRPNRGHHALAHLVSIGKITTVITQNIDNLHQDSGIPGERIVELHGNGTYARCLDCGRHHELAVIRDAFTATGEPPDCDGCGGVVKSATISFGQPMPVDAMRRAEAATTDCDLFLAIGSSLVVYPAAGFPLLAKRNGAGLVIVNREPTGLDTYADLVVAGEIGEILEPLASLAAA